VAGHKLAYGLAVLTLASTIFTKAHPVPHLPLGVALAVFFQRAVYNRLVASRALEPVSAPKLGVSASIDHPGVRLALVALAPMAALLAGEELARFSGWHTDIPAMLGFQPAAAPGFLGLRHPAAQTDARAHHQLGDVASNPERARRPTINEASLPGGARHAAAAPRWKRRFAPRQVIRHAAEHQGVGPEGPWPLNMEC
jgi:hypothetical protein